MIRVEIKEAEGFKDRFLLSVFVDGEWQSSHSVTAESAKRKIEKLHEKASKMGVDVEIDADRAVKKKLGL